jgi:hypothetical protein
MSRLVLLLPLLELLLSIPYSGPKASNSRGIQAHLLRKLRSPAKQLDRLKE